jgi:hypothetical protein
MEVAVMSLSAREQEALDRIAAGIASSDSNLAAMLNTFARLTADERMPEGEEVKPVRRSARQARKPRSRPRRRYSGPVFKGDSHLLAYLPAAVILLVTAVIAVTAALSGGGKERGCVQMRGLACVSQVTAYPSAQRPG